MAGDKYELQLRLRFDDKMDRELTSELKQGGWVGGLGHFHLTIELYISIQLL